MDTMKYIGQKLTLTLVLLMLFLSCTEDYFDTKTGGRIDPEEYYKSFRDATGAYLGCFVYLQDIAENIILVDGLRSDQMDVTNYADPDMIAINRHDLDANNPYIDPSGFYKLIININEVLPNLPQIMELDRDFDSTYMVQYTGGLVTMRSWAYLMLAKLNGEVGLVDEDLSSFDASKPPVYLSKDEIIDQLIEELLPYVDENDLFRYAIDHYVLLGELYLEKEDFTNAAKYLKFAVDGPAFRSFYKLSRANSNDDWADIFLNSVGSEFVVRVTSQHQPGGKIFDMRGNRHFSDEGLHLEDCIRSDNPA